MSKIQSDRIVIEGHEGQRLPGFSLYMVYTAGGSNKDVLFEFSNQQMMSGGTSMDPRDFPALKWDVWVSYGRIPKEPKERTRKQLFSSVSATEAIDKIRDEILRSYKGYEVMTPVPSWWTPLPVGEIQQVKVMLAHGIEQAEERERLAEKYTDDRYIVELKYNGHRAKGHFYGPHQRLRFDSRRQSDVTGLYSENTDQLPHLSNSMRELAVELHGTIIDCEMIHPSGLAGIGSIMGSLPQRAIEWQTANGWATAKVFDCLCVKGTWIIDQPWDERRAYVDAIVEKMKAAMGPWGAYVDSSPFWEGTEAKKAARKWAFENGHEGLILKDRRSKYVLGGRGWAWVKDKKEELFDCVITGSALSTSEKYGPKGWIEHIKVAQYLNSELVHVADVGSMPEYVRQWLSENRERIPGLVVEVEAQERIHKTMALRHPRFVRFRQDKPAKDCTISTT